MLYQPALFSEKDCVYKDSILIEEEPKRTEIYDRILQLSNIVSGKQSPIIKQSRQYVVLKGQFNAQDEKGRRLAFLFVTDNEDVKGELNAICSQIGYTLAVSTVSAIDSFQYQKKNKQHLVYALSAVGICLITYSLFRFLCR